MIAKTFEEKIIHGPGNLLGLDLFSLSSPDDEIAAEPSLLLHGGFKGEEVDGLQTKFSPFDKDCTFFNDIEKLGDNDQTFGEERPRFYCIGANGWTIQGGEQNLANKNATSIIAVMVYPIPGVKTACYYAAGDGNLKSEEVLRSYLPPTMAVKATHHGSVDAFDPELFGILEPNVFCVSAGYRYGHPSMFSSHICCTLLDEV